MNNHGIEQSELDSFRDDHRLNSRQLDVYRWSDHKAVKQMIDELYLKQVPLARVYSKLIHRQAKHDKRESL